MDTKHFTIIAGQKALDHWESDLIQKIAQNDNFPKIQAEQAFQGRLGVEVTPSIYGWHVRYDSILQDFALVGLRKDNSVYSTKTNAIQFATEWVNQDLKNRYAFIRTKNENLDEDDPFAKPYKITAFDGRVFITTKGMQFSQGHCSFFNENGKKITVGGNFIVEPC